jgi:hypothetical protein
MNRTQEKTGIVTPLYDPQQALEKVHSIPELVPIRFFALLFPLWNVETIETREEGQPYEPVEQFIERGIAEAQLNTPLALAGFYGLEPILVEKVIDSLGAAGHVTHANGQINLTRRGIRSVTDGKKYMPQEGRGRLYFDGYYANPLPKAYYHDVHILSPAEAAALVDDPQAACHFSHLYSFHRWKEPALTRLALQPDTADYLLSQEVSELRSASVSIAYLPIYLIETIRRNTPSEHYYLVCSEIDGIRDEFFERLFNTYPELLLPFYYEKEEQHDLHHVWEDWLKRMELANAKPKRAENSAWQVNLTSRQIEKSKLSLAALGGYVIEQGYLLHLWSEDEHLRRRAALERTLQALERQEDVLTKEKVQSLLQRYGNLLQSPGSDLAALHKRAESTGRKTLAKQIAELK